MERALAGGPAVRVEHDGAPAWGRRDGDAIVLADGTRIPEAEARYLAPAEPTKIIAVHLTYASRIDEYAAKRPQYPSYFMKPPTTLNGHRGVVRRPAGTEFLNYEGELAVVVGRRMHGVGIDDALAHVAGYTCANDVGLHDFRHADRGAMLRVKGQDGFLPLGPQLVPAADFDPTAYTLRTSVNGAVVQEATADDLLFPVAYQLADLCRLITLEPGDVVLDRDAGELAPDAARRHRRGRDRRDRAAGEHDRGMGRRPDGRGGPARDVREHAARRARRPGGRGGAHGREEPHMTKVHVDMNLCQSHGECTYVAPEIFELGDDDVLRWKEEVDPSLREKAQEAADVCPMLAIRVED